MTWLRTENKNFWPVVCLQAAFPVGALFWKTYPGTLSPSVDFFFFLPGLQPNQVWVCFTLHTGECLPSSHTLLSPAANTPQEEEYSSTGGISAAGWVLNLNGKLYYWECLFYIWRMSEWSKTCQNHFSQMIVFASFWNILQYLKTPPGHILSYPDRESIFFI